MRVLIVDDHAIVRDGLRLMLSGEDDIEVIGEASDGAAALTLLEDEPADIVLLDLRMEGMGGFSTLEALTEQHPEVRVLVLTMFDDTSLLRRAIELGARGYLLKGSSKDDLLGAIRTIASGGSIVDQRLTGDLVSMATEPTKGRLSEEDLDILRLLAAGEPNRAIGDRLGLTSTQLRLRLSQIYSVLDASGRADAVANALRRGLIE